MLFQTFPPHNYARVVRAGALVLLMLPAARNSAHAETVTLNPSQDTYISTRFEGPNGTGVDMVIGTQGSFVSFTRNRGLIQFDLSTIPAGVVVNSVTLRLTVTRVPASPANGNFQLHRLLRPWDDLESTWTLRLEPDENWDTPGGQEGADFSETASSSVVVAGAGNYTFASTPQLVADVNAWLANPSANHGWLVMQANESTGFTARRIGSAEGGTTAPVLEVRFDPPAPPLSITSSEISGEDFCLRFTARQGKSYVVERREMVDTGTWTAITNLPPATATAEVVICEPLGTGRNFYRVGEQ